MTRTSELAAVLVAVLASAWLAGGFEGVRIVSQALLVAVPFLAIGWASVTLARLALPSGAATGPLAVGGLAVVALLVWWTSPAADRVVGVALVIGGVLVIWRPGRRRVVRDRPTARVLCIGGLDRISVEGGAPYQLSVTSLGATVKVDYGTAAFPGEVRHVYLQLTVVSGRIELRVPDPRWQIVAGRMATGDGVTFEGTVDRYQPIEPEPMTEVPPQLVVNLSARGRSCVAIVRE